MFFIYYVINFYKKNFILLFLY
jgi:hypothetical protein